MLPKFYKNYAELNKTVKIYVSLLEEGTPTWRPTQATEIGENLYELLATTNYDPEDEVWEFEPGSIVMGRHQQGDTGEKVFVAVRVPVSKTEILKDHPGGTAVQMHVFVKHKNQEVLKETQAIDLKNGLFKLLPTADYDPENEMWEFSPGSVVRAVEETNQSGNNILLAFDQIREDRMDSHYARHVLKQ